MQNLQKEMQVQGHKKKKKKGKSVDSYQMSQKNNCWRNEMTKVDLTYNLYIKITGCTLCVVL